MTNQIGVVGLWHLGCVLSVSWSKLGNAVVGVDEGAERIKALNKGKAPLFEPGLDEEIVRQVEAGHLRFSTDLKSLGACDFIFLSYDTPVRDDDSSDTTILEKTVKECAPLMKDHAVLIVSSQSPVGFCRTLRTKLQKVNPSLDIAYSPENLRLGEAIQCYLNPGRIILGIAESETEKKCRLLFSQINAEVQSMSLESAEMVKHGINSFLANSIVFANHLADICELQGARIEDVVKGMKTDSRIGQGAYLAPGIGFSGGTLGRDLKVLESINESAGGFARLFGAIHQFNAERKASIIEKIKRILGVINGKNVGVLGITYKPGTSTLRRSLPLEIVDLLIQEKADVRVYDPKADYRELAASPRFRIASSIADVSRDVDLLLLLTEWSEFRTYDWKNVVRSMKGPVVFDTKNFLNEEELVASGFNYFRIGRQQWDR
jgi:UDPglucose 6-dehydrogenase